MKSFSVVVCTYQAPRELDLVLCGLSRQTRLPDEVLVADDGSASDTRDLVSRWAEGLPFPVKYCWHEDKGYRKARIVNEAVRRSNGNHLLFLDGDSFPHKDWVRDHAYVADKHRVLCGRRVKLGPDISTRVSRDQILSGFFDSPWGLLSSALAGDIQRLPLGLRLPAWLARVCHPRARRLMGVNFSLPRQAFFEVNGLDEEWTFYGREDLDLELRLKRAGFPFFPLLNRGIVFHLHHPQRERSERALRRIEEVKQSDRVRCLVGVERAILSDSSLPDWSVENPPSLES